jgi:hypothetical protein
MRGQMIIYLVVGVIGLLLPRLLVADEIELRNGGRVEGKVVKVTSTEVHVKTRFGLQTFPRRDVVRIAYKKTPTEEFAARLEKLDRRDVLGLLALADWAARQKLPQETKRVYGLVLEVDPGNRTAHEALGHVQFEGRWMTRKEAEAARQAHDEADKLARGLVRYQGEWVTQEEKEGRERGWIKVGERWLPPEEANRARGLVRVGDRWVPKEEADALVRGKELERFLGVKFHAAGSARFRVFSEFDLEHAKSVLAACEKALTLVRNRIGYGAPVWKPELRCEVVMLRTPSSYMKLTDRVAADTRQPAGWAEFTKRRTSFYTVQPPASVQHMGGRRKPDLVYCTVHHVGHIALNGMYANHTYLPVWLDEGFAAWVENATLGQSLTACATFGYGLVAARQDKWSSSAGWKPNLKNGLTDGSVMLCEALFTIRLNEMGWKEIAKAWSLIDWWITEDRAKFLQFVKAVRRRYPRYDKHKDASPKDFLTFQNAALEEVYQLDDAGIEQAWRKYVSTSY